MESSLLGSPKIQNVLRERRTVKFHPSVWGKNIISYVSDEKTLLEWRDKAKTLKAEVLELLCEDHGSPNRKSDLETLSLIDAIQRLGVAYHFEQQIEEQLAYIYKTYHDHSDDDDDLHTVVLRFRLLREHGYKISCDIFRKFVDNSEYFKKSTSDDVDGVLSLYEATFMRV